MICVFKSKLSDHVTLSKKNLWWKRKSPIFQSNEWYMNFRRLLPCPSTVPKHFGLVQMFHAIPKKFWAKPKDDFHLVNSIFVPAQLFFRVAQNSIQFLVGPKQFVLAKNILGPVEGQDILHTIRVKDFRGRESFFRLSCISAPNLKRPL